MPFLRFLIGLLVMLHFVFAVMAAVGVIFLLAWAIRHFPVHRLKTMGIWMLAVGVAGAVLMGVLSALMHGGYGGMRGEWGMKDGAMMKFDRRVAVPGDTNVMERENPSVNAR